MSWKPSRNSGITFDKATRKAEKAREEIKELLPSMNPPRMEDINKLSRLYYSYYLNDNKANKALSSKLHRSFSQYVPDYFLNIFKRNQSLVYKPVVNHL